jgi:D-3-phosphoglycerate dehydrogenase
MKGIAFDPYPNEAFAADYDVSYVPLDELLSKADVVTLHAPAEPHGGPLIGTHEIAMMKPGAIVVNTARGALIDENALVEALRSGHLGGAGLDAFVDEPVGDTPLTALDNVVLTPHIGGSTYDGRRLMGEAVVENLLRALRGEEPLYRVV